MSSINKTPGVYRQEVVLRPDPGLMTGVAGFVGFADLLSPDLSKPDLSGSDLSGEQTTTPVIVLHRKDEFDARIKTSPDRYLAAAVAGFFQNGGVRCYVACARPVSVESNEQEANAQKADALIAALAALAPVNDIDLIAVPDAMMIYWSTAQDKLDVIGRIQKAMLYHCEVNAGRMAILDALPDRSAAVIEQRRNIASSIKESENGALYYPWIKIFDPVEKMANPAGDGTINVPPSGHVAGIYARSDARAGVYKAPANEEVLGALDLGIAVKQTVFDHVTPDQDALNPEGVNCLRAFAGRGIRVWGARTLSPDPIWRYVNIRRLFLTLRRWIDLNMGWVSFEPNTPVLWIRVTREIASYLTTMWSDGALAGQTAEQAFYIKCDAETNPQEVREAGEVVTEIGLAPAMPSEFIMVRIVHHTAVEPR